MHIPDGYLGPETYGGLWAATAALWAYASRRLRRSMGAGDIPLVALAAAMSFIVMMFNIPVVGGTSGHATGAVLAAIVLGPWAAFMALSVALAVQALLFGDGGITTLGANSFNIAFAGMFCGYLAYRLTAPRGAVFSRGKTLAAAAFGGYVGANVSAFLAAFQLGLQVILHTGPDGRPIYNPFPLSVTMPAIMLEHLVLLGVLEAAFTALGLAFILKAQPELLVKGKR